jgi:hypothetical protein
MVIPVGPPGAHHILKVVKQQSADGAIRVARSNVYNKVVPFAVHQARRRSHQGHPRRTQVMRAAGARYSASTADR